MASDRLNEGAEICLKYSEDDLLPLSGLNQLLHCERRCALIHIEQIWDENRFTAEGRLMHERVHEQDAEWQGSVRVVRGLRLRSLELGLTGMADVVEFHPAEGGIRIAGLNGTWRPFPVEYKRGKPKANSCDEVQLCGQAMCLEEMLSCAIPAGALFYGKTKKRKDVELTESLRALTRKTAERLHVIVDSGKAPAAVNGPKCEDCSLKDECLPGRTGDATSASVYVERMFEASQ